MATTDKIIYNFITEPTEVLRRDETHIQVFNFYQYSFVPPPHTERRRHVDPLFYKGIDTIHVRNYDDKFRVDITDAVTGSEEEVAGHSAPVRRCRRGGDRRQYITYITNNLFYSTPPIFKCVPKKI